MKENKVVIEMNVSEFLKLRTIICNLNQLWKEISEFMKLERKFSDRFPKLRSIDDQLSYISDSLDGIEDSDMETLLKVISYSDEE